MPSIRSTVRSFMEPKSPAPKLLTLITKDFHGVPVWAVEHPKHGPLLMAQSVLLALDYDRVYIRVNGTGQLLKELGVTQADRIHLKHREFDHRSLQARVSDAGSEFPKAGANFLTRATVHKLLMASSKPKAQEFRDWLAGVSIAVQDTGGYLLNEAARDTAFADTRTTVPLPDAIAGGYSALIEARQAELEARKGERKPEGKPSLGHALALGC